MKKLPLACAFLAGLSLPALADPGKGRGEGNGGGREHVCGAPGPIAAAGIPFLAIGYGAYWLVRRYRRKSESASS